MKKYYFLIFLAGFGFAFIWQQAADTISRSDVLGAQKLLGITMNNASIDTLLPYLERNRQGYDSMAARPLTPDVWPAVAFDPFTKQYDDRQSATPNDWQLPASVDLPQPLEKVAFMPVWQLSVLIRSGKLSSQQLTAIYLQRIRKYDKVLQSFITVTDTLAMAQAKKADEELASGIDRGPLHGIPYGVKDLAAFPGYPTTWGAAPYKDQVIDQKAVVIQQLEEAGAVMLGKLVSGSLARGDVWFGGKTKNPWDTTQGASGSSAGPGAATGAGLVAFAIGTETLGSITSPSTRSGISGLRPTYGTVSRAGVMTLSWSMDKVGPMARDAKDCAIIYDAIRGKKNSDRSVKNSFFAYKEVNSLENMKVGYFHEQFDSDSSDNHIHNRRTLEEFKKLGATIEKIDLPKDVPYNAFDIILRAEAGAFFDALVRSGKDTLMVEQHQGSRANSLRQSRFIPAVEYIQANRHRSVLIEKFEKAIEGYDIVISPTFGGRQMLITNLTGHPVISIPNGFDLKGRPTSITLVGNYYDEDKLVAAATLYQRATTYHQQTPPNFK